MGQIGIRLCAVGDTIAMRGSVDAYRVTAYSTMALALGTIILAGATVFLAISNNDILKEMRASERPLVWVTDFGQPFFFLSLCHRIKAKFFGIMAGPISGKALRLT